MAGAGSFVRAAPTEGEGENGGGGENDVCAGGVAGGTGGVDAVGGDARGVSGGPSARLGSQIVEGNSVVEPVDSGDGRDRNGLRPNPLSISHHSRAYV